jgi:hypothetical protein
MELPHFLWTGDKPMNRYVVSVVICVDGIDMLEVRTVFATTDTMAAECIRCLYKESDADVVGIIIRETN